MAARSGIIEGRRPRQAWPAIFHLSEHYTIIVIDNEARVNFSFSFLNPSCPPTASVICPRYCRPPRRPLQWRSGGLCAAQFLGSVTCDRAASPLKFAGNFELGDVWCVIRHSGGATSATFQLHRRGRVIQHVDLESAWSRRVPAWIWYGYRRTQTRVHAEVRHPVRQNVIEQLLLLPEMPLG
jgi:hypothetical protein